MIYHVAVKKNPARNFGGVIFLRYGLKIFRPRRDFSLNVSDKVADAHLNAVLRAILANRQNARLDFLVADFLVNLLVAAVDFCAEVEFEKFFGELFCIGDV